MRPQEFNGGIADVRAVEDAIRATRRYTEGIMTMRTAHPVQGEDFPSRTFIKHYEVYPDTEITWDMPVGQAIDWLCGDVLRVYVLFRYDYRMNKAAIGIKDGPEAIKQLTRAIPGFGGALQVVNNGGPKGDSG